MNCVMVTGATSMIGCALIRECVMNGVHVIALARKGSAKLSRIPESPLLHIMECDLDQMKDLDAAKLRDSAEHAGFPADTGASSSGPAATIPAIDCFYHLGWTNTDHEGRNDPDKQAVNIRYTLDAISLAARCGCRKFVGAGSQAEYGRASVPLNGSVACHPEVAYGVSKHAAGLLAAMKCRALGIQFNWVRILSVYGTNDSPATLIKTFISRCKAGEAMDLGPCTHQWDYLFEDDAGRAFFLLGNRGADGKTYCLGSGESRPLKEYLDDIVAVVNPSYTGAVYGAIPYNEKSVTYLRADISDLTADTGWKPSVPFKEGIGRML